MSTPNKTPPSLQHPMLQHNEDQRAANPGNLMSHLLFLHLPSAEVWRSCKRVIDLKLTFLCPAQCIPPILKLPLEIRNLIYKCTFGGTLIHIIQNPGEGGAKFEHLICRASISEEEALEKFDSESTNDQRPPRRPSLLEGRDRYDRESTGFRPKPAAILPPDLKWNKPYPVFVKYFLLRRPIDALKLC